MNSTGRTNVARLRAVRASRYVVQAGGFEVCGTSDTAHLCKGCTKGLK